MSGPGLTTTAEGRVSVCRIDQPKSRNALGAQLMEQLVGELERLDSEPEARCIVVAGTESVFASGAHAGVEPGGEETIDRPSATHWDRLGAIETPIVAAVAGWALGPGCELALACDMCVAVEQTQFGLPEATLGILPAGGGTQRLARGAGKQRAMELVLTGRRFSAEQALAWGLVNRISKPRTWLAEAVDLAAEIALRAPIAVRLGKRAILEAERSQISEALAGERELSARTLATEDRVEGRAALLEGRQPEFEGR